MASRDRKSTWSRADDLPALHTFVTGLGQDLDAVVAGLSLRYRSGAVEGHNNKIKTLMRQMFGRANFDLLRKRVLLSARGRSWLRFRCPSVAPALKVIQNQSSADADSGGPVWGRNAFRPCPMW
ncbi:transposase [Streptomyces sp. NPDC047049]|uniref:transposase n=1 Tax=Streptomyces sp. NPDC047049 TaxID=3156688 RepID=UPI0033DC20DD